jgi:hypothetical protein
MPSGAADEAGTGATRARAALADSPSVEAWTT